MSVLIDPYMFELSDEQEIVDNISFFHDLIKICTDQNINQRVPLVLYQGVIERINQRAIQPFPIKMERIIDYDLKNTIMQINNSFNNALIKSIESIDIDECSGNQAFKVINNFGMSDDGMSDDGMSGDGKYYEMICTLLIPCYIKQISIDNRILTGNKKQGKQIGYTFQISCRCLETTYIKDCVFTGIEDFISVKEKVLIILKKMKENKEISFIENVDAEMGNHHNHVQADGKKFNTLNDLSTRNKVVLKLLRELGLFKIIFGGFTPKGIKAAGTMDIHSVNEKDMQDILTVKFYAETEFQIETDLYFPKGVGKLLYNYFLKEHLTYKNVSCLVEKIK
ncbi:MAG: hypothetical protein PHX08_22245 [Lachnospiraceae bacterium]|nr:hypothetical protein [Lachnospiraceae bacterium]